MVLSFWVGGLSHWVWGWRLLWRVGPQACVCFMSRVSSMSPPPPGLTADHMATLNPELIGVLLPSVGGGLIQAACMLVSSCAGDALERLVFPSLPPSLLRAHLSRPVLLGISYANIDVQLWPGSRQLKSANQCP